MPPIKFYTDEHIPRAVIRGLRERGVDVLTVTEAGLLAAADETHLQRAESEGRVFITHDDDFLRLHAAGIPHAGIFFVPYRTPIGDIIRGAMLVYQILTPNEMKNHIEFL